MPELQGRAGKQILPWAVAVVHQYNDCRRQHQGLVEAWPK
ncbi:hypothetical protein HMPREF9371_1895 [Neisseria shayeganii 871]|uniref:Uncharacterized protein n=1 Tax=Neisseria shayeganii 871 TaxID=1032488 RepID=G4CJV5_9NEIS|nr:hypothetical protein HMPREF9371_1895 [Neisseria shayeganii 871]